MKRLWDIEHSYYCSESNYFAKYADTVTTYKSWTDFIGEYHDADFDYNLIFRWDWDETDGDGYSRYNCDDNYRSGILKVFWMSQRKGCFHTSLVEVCRNDETAVKEFLLPRWEYMKKLWEGISS